MALRDDAHVTVVIADYIGVDASGKINVVGGGWTTAGAQPNGFSAAQYLAILVDIASGHVGEEFTLTVALHAADSGETITVPGPSGTAEALRVQQLSRVEAPPAQPGMYVPSSMFSRVQLMVAFPNGLPLAAGRRYSWRVEIDGAGRPDWRADFLVAGPPPNPVVGGPAHPSHIPGISPI
jgi:hypothetical protein